MSLTTYLALVVLAVVSLTWETANAYECYQCDIASDSTCDGKSSSSWGKCTASTGTMCFKFDGTADGKKSFVRDCYGASKTGCEDTDTTVNGVRYVGKMCHCDSDLCNGASKMTAAVGSTGALQLLSAIAVATLVSISF